MINLFLGAIDVTWRAPFAKSTGEKGHQRVQKPVDRPTALRAEIPTMKPTKIEGDDERNVIVESELIPRTRKVVDDAMNEGAWRLVSAVNWRLRSGDGDGRNAKAARTGEVKDGLRTVEVLL